MCKRDYQGFKVSCPRCAPLAEERDQLRAEVARLQGALRLWLSFGGPRAHPVGCECGGQNRAGVSCEDLMKRIRQALAGED